MPPRRYIIAYPSTVKLYDWCISHPHPISESLDGGQPVKFPLNRRTDVDANTHLCCYILPRDTYVRRKHTYLHRHYVEHCEIFYVHDVSEVDSTPVFR
jgi:hypothetical protein